MQFLKAKSSINACGPVTLILLLLIAVEANAEDYSMLLPATNYLETTGSAVEVSVLRLHPFSADTLDMEWPKELAIIHETEKTSLKGEVSESRSEEKRSWKFTYTPSESGLYWLVMESDPMWHEATEKFHVHLVKTALAVDSPPPSWSKPVGLTMEIVPLLRPYGNYAGNTFSGKVLHNGAEAGDIVVAVEHYNTENWAPATEQHITQSVITAPDGTFVFSCPLPGWWGFKATKSTETTLTGPDEEEHEVELGAIIWVYFNPNPFIDE